MRGVDFEHTIALGRFAHVGHLRENLLHLERHRALGGDARRRGLGRGKLRGHRNLRHRIAQSFFHGAEKAFVFLRGVFGGLLFDLGLQAQIARRDVLQLLGRLALAPGLHGLERELVNVLRAQQHVVTAVEHRIHHRQLRQTVGRIASGIVNRLLVGGHGGGVFLERHHLLLLGRIEQQQVAEQTLLHAVALVNTELQAATKLLEELLVIVAMVVAHFLELAFDLLLELVGNSAQLAVVLQRLARNVQLQIGRIDNAAHEVEAIGQKLLALIHDEHVGAVECQTLLVVFAVQVKRRAARDEQQSVVSKSALGMHLNRTRGVGEVVEVRLVELVVFLVGHVRLAALPNGHHGIDGLALGVMLEFGLVIVAGVFGLRLFARLVAIHGNGVAHVVAVLLDKALQTPLGKVRVVLFLVGVVFQRKNDIGAVGGALGFLDGIALNAVADPRPRLVAAECAAHNAHFLGNHECGIEAHAELADDIHIVALGLVVFGFEFERARMGDGAQVLLELVFGHADARIAHGNGARIFVEGYVNGQLVFRELHVGIGEALEIELIHSVGRVGDKLAQEDFLIRVNRIDHEVEQLFALCLELLHSSNGLSIRVPLRRLLPKGRRIAQGGAGVSPAFARGGGDF